jgi:hypothetical protein
MLAEGISRLAVVVRKMQQEEIEGSKSAPVAIESTAKDFW